MIQQIVVFLIVAAALGYVLYPFLFRKKGKSTRHNACQGCAADCALKCRK